MIHHDLRRGLCEWWYCVRLISGVVCNVRHYNLTYLGIWLDIPWE